ncbi:hypothetical protein ACJIZ3_021449 [Penstemon smallii]|uniref:Uncharacterized protein n=1 Tax=Penstemon smallii TaxID=265156 RepID=A0ABD3SLP6_9LAMI
MQDMEYEDKMTRVRRDMDNMMQQWQMMMTQGSMLHQPLAAPFNPSLTSPFHPSVGSFHMSSPMFRYMGNIAPFPHQSTQIPPQAQSSPQDMTRPLFLSNDHDSK